MPPRECKARVALVAAIAGPMLVAGLFVNRYLLRGLLREARE